MSGCGSANFLKEALLVVATGDGSSHPLTVAVRHNIWMAVRHLTYDGLVSACPPD